MKKTETNLRGLIVVFVSALIIANVLGARTIFTGLSVGNIEITLAGGALTYAFTFLCTDIISEIWGEKESKRCVKYGFIGQVFATALIFITGKLPAIDPAIDGAFNTLLGQNWVFVLGSLCAYYASQSWDVFIFHRIKEAYIKWHHGEYTGKGRWIWNNGSTMTSQIIDTVVYALISFGIGLGWLWTPGMRGQLIGIMIGQYVLKFVLAALDTPIFYLFTRKHKEKP